MESGASTSTPADGGRKVSPLECLFKSQTSPHSDLLSTIAEILDVNKGAVNNAANRNLARDCNLRCLQPMMASLDATVSGGQPSVPTRRRSGSTSNGVVGGHHADGSETNRLRNGQSSGPNSKSASPVGDRNLYPQKVDSRPIALVTCATGRQGMSVVRHLLARGKFQVRAMTRDPKSSKAQMLRVSGAEVVFGDLDDPASLGKAFQDVTAAFGVQLFGDGIDWETGLEQGKRLVLTAKAAGVKHFLYSTIDDVTDGLAPRTNAGARAMEAKAVVEKFAMSNGLPVTIVNTSLYYENVLEPMHWSVRQDGVLVVSLPMGARPFYMFSPEDTGGVVAKVFESPEDYLGKAIGLAGDFLSGPQLVRVFMAATGKAARYEDLPYLALKNSKYPAGSDRADLFRFFEETNMQRDITASRTIYPQLMTWRKWLRRSGFMGPSLNDIEVRS